MSYVKDSITGAVINMDDSYLKAIRSKRETTQRIESIEQTINDFKSELVEIKDLLLKVLSR